MRLRAPFAAAAVLIAVTGCGGGAGAVKPAGPPPAATIIAQLKTAIREARSVHMTGEVRNGGSTVSLDMSLTRVGGMSGSIGSAGTKLDIIGVGHLAYIKVTGAFLKLAHAPATECPNACGKYVATSASAAAAIIGDLSMSKLLGDVSDSLPRYVDSGPASISGRQVLVLHGSDGSTLDVAAAGRPYPLRAIAPKSSNAGELDFTEWNAVPTIAAPAAGQVISLGQLAG